MSDGLLLDRFLGGDVSAFDELMRSHQDRVFAVCLRMLRDREAALDATQDTFITVYRKAGGFEGRSAFSTWLYRVAVNTCYDHLRRQKRYRADALPDQFDPVDHAASDPFAAVELRPALEEALAALPPDFRAAVILSDLEGMDLASVSEALDVPVGTIKSRLFRARRLLADRLGNPIEPSNPPSGEPHA